MAPNHHWSRLFARTTPGIASLNYVDRPRGHAGALGLGCVTYAIQRIEGAINALLGAASVVD
ncbi:MAG: hypothetical protein WAM53_11965, partial [Terrimicrobiaceae bacterium]